MDEESKVNSEAAPVAEETKEPAGKKQVKKPAKVTISVNKKNFNRSVTTVLGLPGFSEVYLDVDLKLAAKKCGKKFACGSSVVKGPPEDHIEVQGEVETEIIEFLSAEFNIPEDAFKIVEAKGKKSAAKK